MSRPTLSIEGHSESNATLTSLSVYTESISQNGSGLKERNYMGLSDCSSVDSSVYSSMTEVKGSNLNLKATELRLGIPGSQSPDRETDFTPLSSGILDVKPLFPCAPVKEEICLMSQKAVISGNKRGFSDTVDAYSETKDFTFTDRNWMFNVTDSDAGQVKADGTTRTNIMLSNKASGNPSSIKAEVPSKTPLDCSDKTNGSNTNSVPAAKAQVVGWPPIRSYRKNTMATSSKNNNEVDDKAPPGALFVKVSMDGAPYLRKVDLRMYATYRELSAALEKMFSCYTLGQCGPQGAPSRETLSESKMRDLLHGSDYVLTYEDKDGDWMLVGDVPWKMFIESCKRLKIMKGSDAIGLAPRAAEKSKNPN